MDRIKHLVTDCQGTVLEQLQRASSRKVSLARNADFIAS